MKLENLENLELKETLSQTIHPFSSSTLNSSLLYLTPPTLSPLIIYLLISPINDAQVRLPYITRSRDPKNRWTRETDRRDPDEHHPADATSARHDALVAVGLAHGHVVVNTQPGQ